MKVVALLESMWGWRGCIDPGTEAPRFFRINPENLSGRRLYRICGDANLIVTNSCRTVQVSANHHGVPDASWVTENLRQAQTDGCDVFLICGKIAKSTYEQSGLDFQNVLFINHPAWRLWSNAALDEVGLHVRRIAGGRSAE